MLSDTGAIVALLDDSDEHHARCAAAIRGFPRNPLVTTWPCLTEAMYLLGKAGGIMYQRNLWRMIQTQRLTIHNLTAPNVSRMAELMERYANVPMDFADATLVVAAENLNSRRIFTVDRDFSIYRLADGSALEVVP